MKKPKKTVKLESPFGQLNGMKTIDMDKMDAWFDYFIDLDNLARRASKTKGKTDYYAKKLGDIFHKYNAA